ncbi:MAG: hypothetical protein ACI4NE_01865 [Succinivibrio sp.]
MKKLFALFTLLILSLTLTGCVNTTSSSVVPSLQDIKEKVVDTGDTIEVARAKLGTPSIIAVKNDTTQVLAFSFTNGMFSNFGKNFAKGFFTLGLGSKTNPVVIKTAYITFVDGKAENVKFAGYSYITKNRITFWNEAEHELTEEEINSPLNFTIDEIYELYYKDKAAELNVPVNELPSDVKDKEFPFYNIHGHVCLGFDKYFKLKEFQNFIADPEALENDGSRIKEILKFSK